MMLRSIPALVVVAISSMEVDLKLYDSWILMFCGFLSGVCIVAPL